MNKRIIKLFSLLIIFTMLALPVVAAPVGAGQTEGTTPPRPVKEVPAEIMDLFKDGMTIEEFLVLNQGPIPKALESYADTNVTVVVQMDGSSLAGRAAERGGLQAMGASDQKAYNQILLNAQKPVRASIEAMQGATVISQYTKAYNGLLVNVPAKQLQAIRELQGVAAVRRAPQHHITLDASVPLINADDVWSSYGEGLGISVAVIDTGIDYTHIALGGSGNPADYSSNDFDTINTGPAYEVFPTVKVVGGFDFAGTDYDASSSDMAEYIPVPDPDPLDEHGHGTHVASTAAGIGSPGKFGEGVAPAADLYALKVFGAEGSTNLAVDAIEWSMDPNGDGDLSDHVDVINMSIGSDYGPADPFDPDIVASDAASALGIVVVSSAGNAGNTHYITGSPSSASSVIAVAASTAGFDTGPTVHPTAGSDYYIYMPPDFDGDTGHFTETITATLGYAGSLTGALDDELCTTDGITAGALTDMIALVSRGSCAFSDKVNNAAALGAIGAVIHNHGDGGDSMVTMVGDPVAIPAAFVGNSDGVALQASHGAEVAVSAETETTTVPSSIPPDTIAGFSSRGPRGFDSMLKPDVAAPGVGIFAADVGTGVEGTSKGGTSMASPHVAGVAALLVEEHPDWTPEMVKAAMMNTAVDLADPLSAETPRQGAGRVDALKAIETTSFAVGDADLVSLNWGVIPMTDDSFYSAKNISLVNTDLAAKTYNVTWEFGPGSYEDGFMMYVPGSVEVAASPGYEMVPVEILIDGTMVPAAFGGYLEEYYGYVVFTNASDSSDVLRVPFYALPQPYAELDVTVNSMDDRGGLLMLDHTGPITSSLWAYPLFHLSENSPFVGDEGDLRMVGMDYGWYSGSYGDIFVPAFNVHGAWHTPQPYFAEIDMYIDADQDGSDDVVNFNFNYGWFGGGDSNDIWLVIQVDFVGGVLTLGSPYLIYTDYNTGFMEWYLPAYWQYLGGGDTDLDFQVVSFDYNGGVDFTPYYSFDYAKPPISWGYTNDPGPADSSAYLGYWLEDAMGYYYSNPLGLMVVDYNGVPGVGQAYAHLFSFENFIDMFLPIIQR